MTGIGNQQAKDAHCAAGVGIQDTLQAAGAGAHALIVGEDHGPQLAAHGLRLGAQDFDRGLVLGLGQGQHQVARRTVVPDAAFADDDAKGKQGVTQVPVEVLVLRSRR